MRDVLPAVLVAIAVLAAAPPAAAQEPALDPNAALLSQETALANAIRRHDLASYNRLVSPAFFFTDGESSRLRIASRTVWYDLLRMYDIARFEVNDARVRTYGETGIVTMLATEDARIAAEDRTIQYFITDVWVRGSDGWRIAERHSSRPVR